jgi:hypothetical protein
MRVRVTTIEFSDGTRISVPDDGVLLIVGPNNAGKSQALKDLMGYARVQDGYIGRALRSVGYTKTTLGDISEWASTQLPQVVRQGIRRIHVDEWGEVGVHDVVNQWNAPHLGTLTALFLLHADGTSRLTAGDSQASIDFSTQFPIHPVQRAYAEPQIERELDRESKRAFGLGVTVDRYGGSVISLRLGTRPSFQHLDGRPTNDYLGALKALPRLEDQGDGIRSYLGLVLHIVAGIHQVFLIDEPEAFLHPPQARQLGNVLASKASAQQTFIATHSTDVVQGALEGGSSITIVRMTRSGDVNHASVLRDEAVKELWSDPLLRYSNVLDGLFHDAVVLCEGDADCRYYSAVLDTLTSRGESDVSERHPQLLFTHCGGKARIAVVVEALSAVSVPVVVVADFDLLRHEQDVESVVAALGGSFDPFRTDLRIVSSALSTDVKPLRRITVRDELVRKLDALPHEALNPRDVDSLKSVIKIESGWDKAKRSGTKALPQGEASEACDRLLTGLKSLRLLVVPVGELERFVPNVPGHGPSWVTTVLERKHHENPGHEAVEFVEDIRNASWTPIAPPRSST